MTHLASDIEIVEIESSIHDDDDDRPKQSENQKHRPSPVRTTNFSMTEILKPSFGCKNKGLSKSIDPNWTVINELYSPLHKSLEFLDKMSRFNQYCINSTATKDFFSKKDGRSVSPENSDSEHMIKDLNRKSADTLRIPRRDVRCVLSPWPAWVYCTRYSDRPSSGPRSRKTRRKDKRNDEKRPRTAFTNEQLIRLKSEFETCRYLTEQRRQELSKTLNLSESQIKIWFQNKRAKIKKAAEGIRSPLALHLMAQGLYNHSAVTAKTENNLENAEAKLEI